VPHFIGSITRRATRKDNEKLNILSCSTHERWQSSLKNVNANFYMFWQQGIKRWNDNYAPLPHNHILLPDNQLPLSIDFDVVVSQNKFGQFQVLNNIANKYNLPLISIEHTLPVNEWSPAKLEELRLMQGKYNVFISEYSRDKWGYKAEDSIVIHHGVDSETFTPSEMVVKRNHVFSAVNDWINRDYFCGFKLWQEVTKGLPVFVVGDTPGLSKPTNSVAELVYRYRECSVFLNTSLISPIPTVLLEAMSCGCACVSTSNCMIPEIIEHGVNGFLSNDPAELNKYCQILLKDVELCKKLGNAARKTIVKRFSIKEFSDKWEQLLRKTADES
jgi:hypothetical protein